MRAAVLYGKEDVRVEEVLEAPLKEGEVRLKIAAALTCGTDLKVFKRGYHARMIVPPAVFGHEMAGTISEVGPGIQNWQVSQRVVVANSAPCGQCFYCRENQENLCDELLFLNGAYASSIVIPSRLVQKNLIEIKSATAFSDAALTEPLACVVQGLEDLKLAGHEKVLVIGAGPIGLMFVALARNLGCEVVVAGRGETRLATALQLGAASVIEVGPQTVEADFKKGRPFDVVFEAVGKPETWELASKLVRKGGKVNFFGGCPSGTTINLDTGLLHYSNLYLMASFHHTPRTIRKALSYIESGVVRAKWMVNGSCNLSELPNLFKSMASGNRVVKTLVNVDD